MPVEKRTKDTITLGSGKLYMIEHTDVIPDLSAIISTVCVEGNRIGYIKGGASIEYTQGTLEEKDDLGFVSKIITTEEEALLKAGLLTWNGLTVPKLVDRSKVTEANGRRITKIGGKGNEQGKYWVVCFFHEDPKDGNLWVLLVGRNTAGLTIAFSTDSGSLIEPEFRAMPHDTDGTLIMLVEETGTGTQNSTASSPRSSGDKA